MLRNAARAALERLPRGASDGQCTVLREAAERVGGFSRWWRQDAGSFPACWAARLSGGPGRDGPQASAAPATRKLLNRGGITALAWSGDFI